ncbi:unnamed protein product [Caretta caretta]
MARAAFAFSREQERWKKDIHVVEEPDTPAVTAEAPASHSRALGNLYYTCPLFTQKTNEEIYIYNTGEPGASSWEHSDLKEIYPDELYHTGMPGTLSTGSTPS